MSTNWTNTGFKPGKTLLKDMVDHPDSYQTPLIGLEEKAVSAWADNYFIFLYKTLTHRNFYIPLSDGNRAEYIFGKQRRITAPHDQAIKRVRKEE